MSHAYGKTIRVSPFRRTVVELMHHSVKVPSFAADRRMDLSTVIAARQACAARPSWCAIFAKAFGIIGRDTPRLRQSFLTFPYERIYEHPYNFATINIDRRLGDESIVIYCLIKSPECRALADMDSSIRHHKDAPLESLGSYLRAHRMGMVPWPLRRLVWHLSLNLIGRRRAENFGTFGVSSVASDGAGLLNLSPVLTSAVHYGLFDDTGKLDMRLTWDHRIMDGAEVARALRDMESVLQREIVRELTSMREKKSTRAA